MKGKTVKKKDIREYRTPNVIANEIRMKRSSFRGAFLLVEGDVDTRLYKRFVDPSFCQVIYTNTKDDAVKVLNILESNSIPGVLCLLDADFWVLEGFLLPSTNIVLTDGHDLEVMMLKSQALEKVLSEYGSESKIRDFDRAGKDIREILLNGGTPIGYLRWCSLQNQYGLDFDEVSFRAFVDTKTLEIDVVKLIKTIIAHSQKHHLNAGAIMKRVKESIRDDHDRWHICCGHDLVQLLSLGLCKAIGSCNTKTVEPIRLEQSLRLAYEHTDFRETSTYTQIRNWEEKNAPYRILLDKVFSAKNEEGKSYDFTLEGSVPKGLQSAG